jgi:glycosyltransferase involved in cell wall biosynthesis
VRRLTVLRVIDRLNVGGPAIHAVLTARGLDPERFRTVLVIGSVEQNEADMGYLLDGSGVEYVTIPSLGRELRPLRDLVTAWKLFRVVKRVRPDVIHTHKAKAGALGRVVALAARVPVRVHTYHGHVFAGYFSPAKTRAFLAIERTLARVTSKLVALSDGLVDELSGRYQIAHRDRFTVVPLGFDLAPFARAEQHRGELRRELGVPDEAELIAIVGRMVPVKDHATFVAACAALAARRPRARFVFIGGGELEAEVRAQVARCGILSQCSFLGWRRDVARLYADLDALALSSVNEGTPVALIEAMSAGVPVAATRVGGVADVLREGARGELCPPRDPAALADAIERALAPTSHARAARIRADVIAEYGGERLCRDLGRLYDELCGRSEAASAPPARPPSPSAMVE